jgi:hypothetical protein
VTRARPEDPDVASLGGNVTIRSQTWIHILRDDVPPVLRGAR